MGCFCPLNFFHRYEARARRRILRMMGVLGGEGAGFKGQDRAGIKSRRGAGRHARFRTSQIAPRRSPRVVRIQAG